MDILIDFLNFLAPYGGFSYAIMFGVLIACGFGLPMPEDIILVTGGILSARGICDLWLTNAVCMAGVLIGDGVIFTLGRQFGERVKQNFIFRRIMNPQMDKRVSSAIAKHGDKIVFIARFMPGLRMPIFLSTGIYGLSPIKFFALDGFAALISVPVWIRLGYAFGLNLELLQQKVSQYQMGLYTLIIGVLALLVVIKLVRVRAASKAARISPVSSKTQD